MDDQSLSPARTLTLEGTFNARDLGGYQTRDGRTTRWRRIFRTGQLHRLTADAVQQLHELGVRTVCDLRSDNELEWTGGGPLFEHGVITHVHSPFLGKNMLDYEERFPKDPAERRKLWHTRGYEPMLEVAASAISSLFGMLADEQRYPLIIHCVAGKDRTGVLSALILRTLGVPDEQVIADYALTAEHRPNDDMMRAMFSDYGRNLDDIPGDVWQSPPVVMEATLRALDAAFGSTEGYLTAIGVPPEALDALRAVMLE